MAGDAGATKKKTKNPGFSGIRDPRITWTRRRVADLELGGKRVAVVGGTNGLGRALARAMASRGARVVVVGRTFRDAGTPGITHVPADLESMREAVRVAGALEPETLDVLVLTTGIMAARQREVTREGVERDLAVSYLSRFVLLRELAPRMTNGRPRVFVMGFPGTGQAGDPSDLNAERAYEAFPQHMNTVAGNEALVLDAAERHPHLGVFGLNPGLVKTDIRSNYLGDGSFRHRAAEWLIGLFTPSPEGYAERTVPLLFAPELEGATGVMFDQKADAILPSEVLTETRVAAFVDASDALARRALA